MIIVKPLKDKKCKVCSVLFTPLRPFQICCTWQCSNIYAKELNEKKEKKDWQKRKATLKKELLSLSDWLKLAQQVFNKYIRERDKNKPCISCGNKLIGKFDAGHLWSAGGHSNLRFNEFNTNGQCVYCNQHLHGNISMYRINFVKRYSPEILNQLDEIAHVTRKYNIQEIKELIELYKNKLKNI